MSCGKIVLQILLCVFNFFAFAAGGLMTGFGIFLVIKGKEYGLEGPTWILTLAFTAVGGAVLLISLVGFIGTCCLNKCFLVTYAFLLIFVIICQIASAVLMIVCRNKFKPFIEKYVTQVMNEAKTTENNTYFRKMMNLQAKLDCCGATGPQDWSMPNVTCCHRQYGDDEGEGDDDEHQRSTTTTLKPGTLPSCTTYPTVGCVDALDKFVTTKIFAISATAAGIALFEICAAITALVLATRKE